MNWYNTLNNPPLTPPAFIFQPAWVFLYTTIFVSLIVFIFAKTNKNKTYGYILFFIQLLINMSWTPIFFIIHNMAFALIILIILDIIVLCTLAEFLQVSKTSAIILLPYLFWILFATYLNAGFLILN